MPAPPCDELGHVAAGDLGQGLVLAEECDQPVELPPRIAGTAASEMRSDLRPPPTGDVVEAQRCARGLDLRDALPRRLALSALYRLRFPPGRGLG
jgi:hypothetical protein